MTDTEERSSKRLKTTGEAEETAPAAAVSPANLPSIPVFSRSDIVLNEDTMEVIVDFVNGASEWRNFTAVSKAFHAALIPRQKKVWLGGFNTWEDFVEKGFRNMEFFSARNSVWIQEGMLEIADHDRFPKLQGVDFTGCIMIDERELLELIKSLGSRLKTFIMGRQGPGSSLPISVLQELAAHCSTPLTSLELHHLSWNGCGDMFEKLTGLRELALGCLFKLPNKLPTRLEVLRLSACELSPWSSLAGLDLPNLKTLEITDFSPHGDNLDNEPLSAQLLISVMSKSKKLETFILRAVGTRSTLYLGDPVEEEEKLFRFLKEKKIKYIGPKHVTQRAGADFVCRRRFYGGMFVNRSGWVGV